MSLWRCRLRRLTRRMKTRPLPAVLLSTFFGYPGVVNDVDNARAQLSLVVVGASGAGGAWESDVGGSFAVLIANSVLPLSVGAAQLRFVPACRASEWHRRVDVAGA